MALTTTDRVKEYLGITSPDFDSFIGRLVTAASADFLSRIDRTLESAAHTDTWSGEGETVHYLKQFPVTAISGVTIDGVATPARTTGDGYVYESTTGRVELVGYEFTEGVSNCVVVYTAGYTTVPGDIEEAVIEAVAIRFNSKEKLGKATMSVQGQVVDFRDNGGSQFAYLQDVIDRYRRMDP